MVTLVIMVTAIVLMVLDLGIPNGTIAMVAAGMCYGTAAVLSRARTIILERERRSDWALEAAKGGKL